MTDKQQLQESLIIQEEKSKSSQLLLPQKDSFVLYPQRYVMVILYGFAQALTGILFTTVQPISEELKKIYNVSSTQIALCSILYFLMHPLFTFTASSLIDKYGIKSGLTIGIYLIFISNIFRCLINVDFGFVVIGQLIAGIARPFIVNSQAKIGQTWFPQNSAIQVTSLLSFIFLISNAIGFLISGGYFADYEYEKDETLGVAGKQLGFELMVLQFVICIVCLTPSLLFFKEKPPTPPSLSSVVHRINGKEGLQQLVMNKNYVKLFVVYGFFFGGINAMGAVLAFMIAPFGFNAQDASMIATSPVLGAIVGISVVIGWVKRTKKFRLSLMVLITTGQLIYSCFYLILNTYSLEFGVFCSMIGGFCQVPSLAILFEFAIELTFPVGEALTVGILIANGQLFGSLITFILIQISPGESKMEAVYVGLFYAIMGAFILVLLFVIEEDLRKTKLSADQSKANIPEPSSDESRNSGKHSTQHSDNETHINNCENIQNNDL